MNNLTFITSHPKKAEELSWHLNIPVVHHKLDLPEIQSLDPREVVTAKAQEAYKLLGRPVLVEDYSLRMHALGKLPGPLIKWFIDEIKAEGICKLIEPGKTRRATAQTSFALCDETGIHIFDGVVEGTIATEMRGERGYGTDAIFIPDGWDKTWGEMNKEEQKASSIRAVGLKKLETHLATPKAQQ